MSNFSAAAATDTRPRVGLYPGLSRTEYEAIDAINVSKLEHFERSAAHAREAIIHPPEPTEAMNFGTALHVAVLQPLLFKTEYAGAPQCDRRTKDGKRTWAEFEEEHPRATILTADDYDTLLKMSASVWAHPIASELLRGHGHNEVGIVFENAETGLICKGLLDRISGYDGWTWIIDLKSSKDASRREFARSIKNFRYGAKAAFYLDGCNAVAPRERRFVWVAIEKTPPYAVALYEPDESAISAGRLKYTRWLRLYDEAKQTGAWPGYELGIQPMAVEDTEWRTI